MENKYNTENMLTNLDRVIRLLRRGPQRSRYANRGTYRLLIAISNNPGLSTKDLAKSMDIRRSSLNERLFQLESEGMIIRKSDINDKRISTVYLGESAKDYLSHLKEVRLKKNDTISGILTDNEIDEFTRLSEKLADGLETNYLKTNKMRNKKELRKLDEQ